MAIYLYTVENTFSDEHGLCAERGMRLSEIAQCPELKSLRAGIVLELRLPEGTVCRTYLANYGIGVIKQHDGSRFAEVDPFLRFTLLSDLPQRDVPKGTEIWWLDTQPGMNSEEVERMLAKYR